MKVLKDNDDLRCFQECQQNYGAEEYPVLVLTEKEMGNAVATGRAEGIDLDGKVVVLRFVKAEDKGEECRVGAKEKPFTLEDAIAHTREVAKRLGYTHCGREHAQLGDWLEELLILRKRIAEEDRAVRVSRKDWEERKWKSLVEGKESQIYKDAINALEGEGELVGRIMEKPCRRLRGWLKK